MTKVLRNGEMYERVFYEQEEHFENIAIAQLKILLPDFYVLPFKLYVQGEEGLRRKPDLALIHKDCSTWAIVEVELAHHSLERHVYPQLQCFATGLYNDGHAGYLARKCRSLSYPKVSQMIKYVEPKVMVLVNSTDVMEKGWGRLSIDLGVKMSFLETFRSAMDETIFRFDGYLPRVRPMRIAGARKHQMINALRCRPATYFDSSHNELTIFVKDQPVVWRIFTTADSAILTPRSPIELSSNRNYDITQHTDGTLHLSLL